MCFIRLNINFFLIFPLKWNGSNDMDNHFVVEFNSWLALGPVLSFDKLAGQGLPLPFNTSIGLIPDK